MSKVSRRFNICAARQDHAGKTRWVKLGEAIEWDGASITLDLDTLPAGPWWDGKLRLFVQDSRSKRLGGDDR